jgi:hypothetical protein
MEYILIRKKTESLMKKERRLFSHFIPLCTTVLTTHSLDTSFGTLSIYLGVLRKSIAQQKDLLVIIS